VEILFAADATAIEGHATKLLNAKLGDADALAMLVCARRLVGDLAGLREMLESMRQVEPDNAQVAFELGCVLRDMEEPDAAAAAFATAVRHDTGNLTGLRLQADQLARGGKPEAARQVYSRCAAISIEGVRSLERAIAAGDPAPALEVVTRQPTDVCASLMLAELEIRLNRFADAELRLCHVLELAPNFPLARYTLATALFRQAKAPETIAQLDLLLKEHPANIGCLNMKALSLSHVGEYERSLACYETLLKEAPETPAFWVGYGHVLKTVGRVDEAIAAFRNAVELQPALGDAYWQLADLKTFRFRPSDMRAMRKALAEPAMTKENRAQLHFALAKALEDNRDYEGSFEEYAKANAIRRQTQKYDPDENSALVRRSKATFTEEFFRHRSGTGALAPDPIFIVGLTRSGSTLIEQMLASHSLIEGTAELPAISALAAVLPKLHSDQRYPETLTVLDPEDLMRLGEEYLAATRIHRKLGRAFFIDKMPHNFQHLALIHLILPKAKIVDVRRHPLACGFANFKQHFTRGQPWSYDLREIGRYYRDYVELMTHYDRVLPGRIHRVIYEQIVANPEDELRRLLDYCGLSFEAGCLRFHENRRPVLTASAEQVRRPIFRDSLERWREFEPWLEPLKSALGDVLETYPAAPNFEFPEFDP
jgi:tetratricopeptide (TPR) repeat protein